jgi:hypothetical protein
MFYVGVFSFFHHTRLVFVGTPRGEVDDKALIALIGIANNHP